LYVNEEDILATPGWSEASDWLTRFAHVMATGKNVTGVINNCREVAQNVILRGYLNDTPTSTTLKLSIDS
jgi:hypothetical protein